MESRPNSREHHWWPVGLQRYWADKIGDISWIDPEGNIHKKRVKNRKVAYKSHGHTLFRGSVWETNFENDFSTADNSIPVVIGALEKLKPLDTTPSEFFRIFKLLFKRDHHLAEMAKYYQLDEIVRRKLLLLIFSLLIRSPGNRFRYEGYSKVVGLPPNEEVGKVNMSIKYQTAKNLCEKGHLGNQCFILIHSPFRRFIFGDGHLDWLTGSLTANRIDGRALVPLTPHLCVYFCTPRIMRSPLNCASFTAAFWMIDWINDIIQIYSRDKIFFIGKPPVLKDSFRQRQFFEHAQRTDDLIDMLDELAGNKRGTGLFGFSPFR